MKGKVGEPEENCKQVYGDKFSEYDKVCNLVNWLNHHGGGWSYFLKEVEVEK